MSLNYSRVLWGLCPLFFFSSVYMKMSGMSIFLEFCLMSLNSVQLSLPIVMDLMSFSLMLTVFFISANVLHLAHLYMEDEVFLKRFTLLVLLFIGSMGALIFIPHITALLVGWDGLGLVSLLLVIYYASPKALGAGMLTALSNRLGDAMILISVGLMVEYNNHLELISFYSQPVACFSLMVAGMTKSAQFPLSAWLPAAMEAPTPVSALVHSSTLVTAGVYLMVRFYSLLAQSEVFSCCILIIGVITSMFAGISAMVEYDMKKIIALSTLSQLGLMMVSLGLGYPKLALFHLIMHAMFKALLFVCAGVLIHFHGHAQDIRQMGGISYQFPFTSAAIGVSKFSLCAFPLMSGFYSKDSILEMFFWSPYSGVSMILAMVATMLTAMYSMRFFIAVVFPEQKSVSAVRFAEPIIVPMASLAVGAIIAGSVVGSFMGPFCMESLSPWAKISLIVLTFMSPLLVLGLNHNFSVSKRDKKVLFFSASSNMFFLSTVSTQGVLSSFVSGVSSMAKTDQSWLEIGQFKPASLKTGFVFPAMVASVLSTMFVLMVVVLLVLSGVGS